MSSAAPASVHVETFNACCAAVNPCEAKCMIENALVARASGKTVRRYEIGDQEFELSLPSLNDLRSLLQDYERKCALVSGRRTRAFGRFSTPACRTSSARRTPLRGC